MARLLLDENFPRGVAAALVAAGHDAAWVADLAPGATDRAVLSLARDQRRLLLTFDADFGELLYRDGEAPPPGVLLFRLHPIAIDEVCDLALAALQASPEGQFTVVSRESLRSRPLPPSN